MEKDRSLYLIDHYEVDLKLAGGYDYTIGKCLTLEALIALIEALCRPDINGPATVTIRVMPNTAPPGR